jgi:hypothetical protein
MLDWMLVTRRRVGFARTVQDRSRSAASKDWTTRPVTGHVRACGLEDGTAGRRQVRSHAGWNTGWHQAARDLARSR